MEGNIFALALLGLLLVCVLIIKKAGTRPSIRGAVIATLLGVVVFAALVVLTPRHMCRRGDPIAPTVVGVLCATAVFAAVERRGIRIAACIGYLVAGIALTFWGMELVHRDGYVGNRNWPQELDRIATSQSKGVQEALREANADHPTAVLPEGWIEKSLKTATGEDLFKHPPIYMGGRISCYWHTWFTGIYRLDEYPTGIWCRGGPLAECIDRIEIRERRNPNQASDAIGVEAAPQHQR